MLVLTLIAVLCGMISVVPGLGILLSIACLPVLIRTMGVVRKREEAGLPTSLAKRILLFISSLGVTLVTAVVLCVASVGTFCAVCVGLSPMGTEQGLILFSSVVAVIVTIGVFGLCFKWFKTRWRRDTQEP